MNFSSVSWLRRATPSAFAVGSGRLRSWTVSPLMIGLAVYMSCYWPADTSFLSYSLAGAFAIHLWSRPQASEVALIPIAALLFLVLYLVRQGVPALYVATPGFFLGLGSLAVLGIRGIRERKSPPVAFPALLLPTALVVTVLARPLWTPANPAWDWAMLAFDARLGGQLSFVLGRAFAREHWIAAIHQELYNALPLGMAFLYAAHMGAAKSIERQRVIILLLTTPLLCALIYRLVPVVGPKFAFPDLYPWRVPTLPRMPYPLISLNPETLRNGLPSMHFGWALLIWWGLYRRSAMWAWVSGAFVVLTVIATLGLGQHYLIDLIVAVPFVGMLQAAIAEERSWWGARVVLFGGGLLATMAWIWVLRQPDAWGSGTVLVLLSALSVAVPLWLVRKLDRPLEPRTVQ